MPIGLIPPWFIAIMPIGRVWFIPIGRIPPIGCIWPDPADIWFMVEPELFIPIPIPDVWLDHVGPEFQVVVLLLNDD
nr:hypothetical protein BaRGS_003380 [Batillaria attramentaria]